MSVIEFSAEVDVAAAPADVAAVLFDPAREPEWMKAVTSVEVIDQALAPGARVKHSGAVMGHEFAWTTRVETVMFPHVLAMAIIEGPFTGTVRYKVERTPNGSRVRIHNVGQPSKLSFLPAALLTGPLQTALVEDLQRLKVLIEQP